MNGGAVKGIAAPNLLRRYGLPGAMLSAAKLAAVVPAAAALAARGGGS
jgi:hypothetical protein